MAIEANSPLLVPPAKAWALLGVSNSTGYELLAEGCDTFPKLPRHTLKRG